MGNPIVKICGLTRPEDVESAIYYGASFLGFVIECNSPRKLSVLRASLLSRPVQGLASRVAVTVNPDNYLLAQITAHMKPDYIQLHGDETPERCAQIKSVTGRAIIKSISVRSKEDLISANDFADVADYILLDAKPPKNAAQRGGHGTSFSWSVLEGFKPKTPYILAGGLTQKNIGMAMQQTGAHVFDVSSGVESAPGVKDAALMEKLMKAARAQ